MTFECVNGCLNASAPPCFFFSYESQECNALRYATSQFVNKTETAMWILFSPTFDPLGSFGAKWLKDARSVLDKVSLQYNVSLYLCGINAESLDAISAVYGYFPLEIGVGLFVVLIFVGITNKSVLIPLRSVLSIALTLGFTYGFVNLVYDYGILEWMHFAPLANYHNQIWLPPIVSFAIIAGIAVDYDIFIITRIREYRLEGYSTRDATIRGLEKTGSLITSAGIIMFIAFGGLLFSSILALNQLSIYLALAVLFDTIFIRSLFVPSILSFLNDANWWPSKLPPITKAPITE
eukprot:TRINITY_DN10551_c0_g1_i1.p1 TRINITY_DN10551_c0_g1~~TRINITY_DN10551_c0_g1_i1.p1  ORF type:complete len:293 (-),score=30.89 TRINITY_DN10551_c0_g1_i1:40-918(-)